jgi:hypothetical protein
MAEEKRLALLRGTVCVCVCVARKREGDHPPENRRVAGRAPAPLFVAALDGSVSFLQCAELGGLDAGPFDLERSRASRLNTIQMAAPCLAPTGPAARPLPATRRPCATARAAAVGAPSHPITLVASDVDGTMLDSQQRLSQRVIDAVAACEGAGVPVRRRESERAREERARLVGRRPSSP